MNFQCHPTSIKVLASSHYVVNNSFHCGLQHKRVSIDTQLYSLVHKKIWRKAMIDRKFEETLRDQNLGPFSCGKGFKGKTLSNFSAVSFKKGTPKVREEQSSRVSGTSYLTPSSREEERRSWHVPQSVNRPNMMCNLTLYRKGWKRSEGKGKCMSLGVIENSKKIKAQPCSNSSGPVGIRIKTVL